MIEKKLENNCKNYRPLCSLSASTIRVQCLHKLLHSLIHAPNHSVNKETHACSAHWNYCVQNKMQIVRTYPHTHTHARASYSLHHYTFAHCHRNVSEFVRNRKYYNCWPKKVIIIQCDLHHAIINMYTHIIHIAVNILRLWLVLS